LAQKVPEVKNEIN